MLPILNQSFWRDEAFSVLLSKHAPLDIVSLTIKDQSPPLYSLLLHYWMILFGESEAAIRGMSVLFHFLLAGTVFLLVRKLTPSRPVQLLITTAVLINPFLLQYAFEARMYTLLALLITLSVYAITIKKYWIAGIFLSLALLTHNFALFSCIALGIWWMVSHKEQWKIHLKEGISLFLIPLCTVGLWGLVVWNQWERVGKGFWIKPVTSQIFLDSFQKFAQGDLLFPSQHMLLLISFILVFFAFSYWVWKKQPEESSIPSLLFSVTVIPVILTYTISLLFAPIYHERYLIASVPLLIVLVGYSLFKTYSHNVSRQMLLIIFVSAYMTVLLLSSEQIVSQSTKASINWAVSQILSRAQPGDIIVPKDVLNYLETKLYVEQSGSTLPVYAFSPNGKIPFYIGSVLFDQQHILKTLPKNKRIWQIYGDGGYSLLQPQPK